MANRYLDEVVQQIADGKTPSTTVRAFLLSFDAYRRRAGVVERIRSELSAYNLLTVPDFESAWVDSFISFQQPLGDANNSIASNESQTQLSEPSQSDQAIPSVGSEEKYEASFKVSKLTAANAGVIYINPQASIQEATTTMLAHDYSQLPVMTSERTLVGVISWKSIGLRLSQMKDINQVKDAMDAATEIIDTTTIFDAISTIISNDFTVVRSTRDGKITGIITATDLSEQLRKLSGPFLLLSEIEKHIRNLIRDKFTADELKAACNEGDIQRRERVFIASDLTFGEYLRLLEKPENWKKISFKGDRIVFCKMLAAVGQIRNAVMHIDPEGILDREEDTLRKFSRFLNEIDRIV